LDDTPPDHDDTAYDAGIVDRPGSNYDDDTGFHEGHAVGVGVVGLDEDGDSIVLPVVEEGHHVPHWASGDDDDYMLGGDGGIRYSAESI
jgi:hypothetical protein